MRPRARKARQVVSTRRFANWVQVPSQSKADSTPCIISTVGFCRGFLPVRGAVPGCGPRPTAAMPASSPDDVRSPSPGASSIPGSRRTARRPSVAEAPGSPSVPWISARSQGPGLWHPRQGLGQFWTAVPSVRSDLAHAPQGRFQCGDDGWRTIPILPARWPGAPVGPAAARWYRPLWAASSRSPLVDAPCQAPGAIGSTAWSILLQRCGPASGVAVSERVRIGRAWWRKPQLVRAVTRARKVHPMIQFAAGATFRGAGPIFYSASCNPEITRAQATQPSAGRGAGRTGNSRAQVRRAPVGTRPLSTYRQGVASSLRARAVIMWRGRLPHAEPATRRGRRHELTPRYSAPTLAGNRANPFRS